MVHSCVDDGAAHRRTHLVLSRSVPPSSRTRRVVTKPDALLPQQGISQPTVKHCDSVRSGCPAPQQDTTHTVRALWYCSIAGNSRGSRPCAPRPTSRWWTLKLWRGKGRGAAPPRHKADATWCGVHAASSRYEYNCRALASSSTSTSLVFILH